MGSDSISLPRSKSSLIVNFVAELLDVQGVFFVDIVELRDVPDEFVVKTANSIDLRLCFITQGSTEWTFMWFLLDQKLGLLFIQI